MNFKDIKLLPGTNAVGQVYAEATGSAYLGQVMSGAGCAQGGGGGGDETDYFHITVGEYDGEQPLCLGIAYPLTIEYSTDNRQTWGSFSELDGTWSSYKTLPVQAGDVIWLRGNWRLGEATEWDYLNIAVGYTDSCTEQNPYDGTEETFYFISGTPFAIAGRLTSLYYYNQQFDGVFGALDSGIGEVMAPSMFVCGNWNVDNSGCKMTSCEGLDLSDITTVGNSALYGFLSQTMISAAPDLPNVTYIGDAGCHSMFSYCPNLANACSMPKLNGVGSNALDNMYNNCPNLRTGMNIWGVDTLGSSALSNMYSSSEGVNYVYAADAVEDPSKGVSYSGLYLGWLGGCAATGVVDCPSQEVADAIYAYDSSDPRFKVVPEEGWTMKVRGENYTPSI